MTSEVLLGIMIPFIGTSLGAGMVFFLKNQISENVQKILTGFAAGVMVAASFWSLLQPALESSEGLGKLSFAPAAVGFLVGIGFLLLLDEVTPHMHMDNQDEGPKNNLKRTTKLILAVTLHNIPEGMAVGVVYAGWLAGGTGVSQAAALALRWVLRSRTSRRVRSFLCRCERKECRKEELFCTVCCPALWSRSLL